jgi:hypothetical protein
VSAITGEISKLAPGLIGFLSSVGALVGAGTIAEVLEVIPELSSEYEQRTGKDFPDRVAQKWLRFGLP